MSRLAEAGRNDRPMRHQATSSWKRFLPPFSHLLKSEHSWLSVSPLTCLYFLRSVSQRPTHINTLNELSLL